MPSTSPQPVAAPLTRAAMFLVVTVNDGADHAAAVRGLSADLSGLLRSVGFRDSDSRLSCVMAFGSDAWDRLFGSPKPRELHPFREIAATSRPIAPVDLFFHIPVAGMDIASSFATQIMSAAGGAVSRPTRARLSTSTTATFWVRRRHGEPVDQEASPPRDRGRTERSRSHYIIGRSTCTTSGRGRVPSSSGRLVFRTKLRTSSSTMPKTLLRPQRAHGDAENGRTQMCAPTCRLRGRQRRFGLIFCGYTIAAQDRADAENSFSANRPATTTRSGLQPAGPVRVRRAVGDLPDTFFPAA